MLLKNNHFFIIAAHDIDSIISPLKKVGIHLFTYLKNFEDGSQVYLSNNAQWVNDYYSLKLYETSLFEKNVKHYKSGIVLWPLASDLTVLAHGKNYFDSAYGITIIKKLEDSCEFYFFSSSHNNPEILDFYLNNINLLDRFIIYFRDRAAKLLKKSEQSKIILPRYDSPSDNKEEFEHLKEKLNNNNIVKKQILNETKIYNYRFLSGELKGVKLSKRELDCLINILNNKSINESAQILNISVRTVECYLNNIKLKLNCQTRSELIKKLRCHNFDLDKFYI